ncbi:transcriptional repressor NF-X1-like isoform X2 [Amphiura filiformis]
MSEESQNKTSSTELGAENRERRDNVQSERKRGTGRGRGSGYRYNNQRGQGRRYQSEHDWRGGGDNASDQDRLDGQRQDERPDKPSRFNRDSRSNQDRNWRDASKEANQDSGHRRHKYPDREIYSPRGSINEDDIKSQISKKNESSSEVRRQSGADNRRSGFKSGQEKGRSENKIKDDEWEGEEDKRSNQSRLSKNSSFYEEDRQRRPDNRSGFRGGRGNFRGRSDRGRGQDNQYQGRKGSRFNYDSRKKTDERISGSKSETSVDAQEEDWGSEENKSSDQSSLSKETDEGRQRRPDNRSGFRGERGYFRGRSDRGRGRDSYDHKSDGNRKDNKAQGRKGSRFNYDSRNQTDERISRSKNEISGDVQEEDWEVEEDKSSDQSSLSKKSDSLSYEEGRERRLDNRSGFRGGRGNVRNDRGRSRDSYEHNADGNAKDNQYQGRGGSRFSTDSKSKTNDRKLGSKNEISGDQVEKASKPKKIIKRETFTKGKANSTASQNASDQTSVRLDSKENKSGKKKTHVISADAKPFVPGLRKSPTMGIDQDQVTMSKDVYQGGALYTGEMGCGDEAAYVNAPVGVYAFGVYPDPYGAYGGEGNFDGVGGAEVSIGRGARWNEYYHNLWHGTGPVEPSMYGEKFGNNGRGFAPIRSRPGRGQYQNRQGGMTERIQPQEGQSNPYGNQDVVSGMTFHGGDQYQSRQSSDDRPQPGFVRKGQDRSKSKQTGKTSAAKAKSAKQFSGSNETQTGNLIEQLTEGTYECLVCCDVVKCEARVWSCSSCYTVFHLKCIKEWAKSPAAAAEDSDGWKCPACRFVTIHIPYVYKCFCGKHRDPPWEPGDTPHSCGEVCHRKRPNTNCTHLCNILCHPGPCPQCPTNVQRSCICGKTKQTVRCGAVPVLECQKACNKLLNCATHTCERICHAGKCDDCHVTIVQGCYCGNEKRDIVCGSSPDEEEGPEQFSCGQECGRDLQCGNHKCKAPCHAGDCDPCPLTPETVKHCPCGQTLLDKLLELEDGLMERTKCTDPVPTCQNICGKPLLCGGDNVHTCQQTCHEGDCGPCPGTSMVRCRCGHRYIDIPCAELTKEAAEHTCDRKCTKRKSCGKHKCQQKCCVDSSHLCTQVCGRKLNCGVHVCEALCHPGNCIRCLEASFEELFCHCGASVLMPPIPCGTKPPECTQQCVRRHKCEHTVRHTCHSEEDCPPCAELTSKKCMGGHELRHNLPCYIDDVSCGNPCGRPIPCRQHTCQKTCHMGFCGSECSQPCPKPRPDCGHPCNAPCHPDTPCPKQRCKAKVTIKCGCGFLSETSQCLQGVDDSQLTEAFQKMTTSAIAAQLKFGQASMDMTKLMAFRDDKGQRILECTVECARVERNRRFADALNINDPDLLGNSAPSYIPFLKEQAKKSPAFVSAVEKDFATVVKAVQSKYTSRSHAFSPMNRDQRRVIHELSDFYGLESQSYDQEPQRNVVVTARRGQSHMPSVTLTAVVQQELHPKAPTPIPLNSKYEDLRAASKAAKLSTQILERKKSQEKVIDYFEMT